MTLIYRGQPYTASRTIASVDPQSSFTYRGQSYQRSASISCIPQNKLVYRGIPYIPSESATIPSFSPAFN